MSTSIPQILSFNFKINPANPDLLINAWMPEITEAARLHVSDDRYVAFLVAALRLGARSKSLKRINVMQVALDAGYSRSTFFRMFENHTQFLLKAYQLTCLLSTKVYAKHLSKQALSLEEFCSFTADVFYGANCTISSEIIQMLWHEHDLSHSEFHPHLSELAPIMQSYLETNLQTNHLCIDLEELDAVIKHLDLSILNARLEGHKRWGTPFYYNKLQKLLYGYLRTCE